MITRIFRLLKIKLNSILLLLILVFENLGSLNCVFILDFKIILENLS